MSAGHWNGKSVTSKVLKNLLNVRFSKLDFKETADEVRVFLHDSRDVELGSKDFFIDLAVRIPIVQN